MKAELMILNARLLKCSLERTTHHQPELNTKIRPAALFVLYEFFSLLSAFKKKKRENRIVTFF